jgi:penicillin-binding protein 2B
MNRMQRIGLRTLLLGLIFSLLFAGLLIRIFWLQAVDAAWLQEKATLVWNRNEVIRPVRGKIYDRHGEALAYDAPAYTVVATLSKKDPNHIEDPKEVAEALSPVLDTSTDILYKQLNKDAYQVELRQGGWKVDAEKAKAIEALELKGIHLMEETRRFYPNKELAAHLLGYVDLEGKAKMGLELSMDEWLRGKEGKNRFVKDARGIPLPNGELEYIPAEDGADVYLTIDRTIQSFVEQALDRAQREYRPKRMVAIVSDPNSGEILAMSVRPGFDPNQYWKIENYSNYAVSYPFEPGSTFKIITLAAAIEEGLFRPGEKYLSGTYRVPGSRIPVRDHNAGRGWGTITFLEGVQKSSNVLFAKLGVERLGKERLIRYIQQFGFTKKTGIELPGEVIGRVPPISEQIAPRDVAAISFGQAVSVTPIQQVAAVGAVANGGKVLPMTIVKQVKKKDGTVVYEGPKSEGKQVISEETSRQVREILETVVSEGSGQAAYLEGYRVAGKTGTAQKFDEKTGRLIKGEYIASFIGFAPADQPKVLVYVALDAPQEGHYGGTVAAPVFQDIMRNTLHYLRVPTE